MAARARARVTLHWWPSAPPMVTACRAAVVQWQQRHSDEEVAVPARTHTSWAAARAWASPWSRDKWFTMYWHMDLVCTFQLLRER